MVISARTIPCIHTQPDSWGGGRRGNRDEVASLVSSGIVQSGLCYGYGCEVALSPKYFRTTHPFLNFPDIHHLEKKRQKKMQKNDNKKDIKN